MLSGHLDSAALAKAIASFRSFMPAINIGARPGASVENASCALIIPWAFLDYAPPPRRLARPSARRADVASLRGAHRAPVRPGHHHAQPRAAGDPGGGGGFVSRTNPQSGSGRAQIRAADDLLPDRRRRSGRAFARQAGGGMGRGQALSGARHHQLRARRHLDGPHRPRAGGDGEGRHAAAGPWRGDRSPRSTSSTARRCSWTRCWRRCSSGIRA